MVSRQVEHKKMVSRQVGCLANTRRRDSVKSCVPSEWVLKTNELLLPRKASQSLSMASRESRREGDNRKLATERILSAQAKELLKWFMKENVSQENT